MSLQHLFARVASVKSITFQNTSPANPLSNVTQINYLKEEGVTGTFTSKEYRYSFDNKNFSNWNTLTIYGLQAIQLSGNSDLYLEIRYNRVGVNAGDIERLYLLYEGSTDEVTAVADASIDATYFQGQLPEYYLNNENHFGSKYITTNDAYDNFWKKSGTTNVSNPTIIGSVNFTGDHNIDGSLYLMGNLIFDASGSITGVESIDFWNGNGDPDYLEGRVFYDSTHKALTYMPDTSDVRIQLGQENVIRVRNNSGATILDGSPVRISGSQGNRPTIALAQSDIHTISSLETNEIIGLATHDIANNTDGFVTTFGLVNNQDTSGFNEGDFLYLDTSIGQLTNTSPLAPYDKIRVGVVVNSHANQGIIFVHPERPIHLHDLSGITDSSTIATGSVLVYNASTYTWDASVQGATSDGIYVSAEPDGITVSETVGGIDAGTDVSTLTNRPVNEIIDDILFRTLPPTISAYQTLNDSGISSGTLEVGTAQTPTMTGTFTKGLILNGNGSAGPDLRGLPNTWRFKLPDGSTNSTVDSSALIEVHAFSSYNIIKGSNNWSVEVDYDAGTGIYYDSKNNASNILDASRGSGTISDNSPSKTGAYGFFYGFGVAPTDSSGVRAGTKVLLNQSDGGTFDFTFPDAETTIWFSTYGAPSYTVTQDPTGLPIDITGLFSDNTFNVDDAGGTARSYQTSEGYYGAAGHGDLTIRVTI